MPSIRLVSSTSVPAYYRRNKPDQLTDHILNSIDSNTLLDDQFDDIEPYFIDREIEPYMERLYV